MPALTIRNIDPDTKARLRVRAAEEGRSMEEHIRQLIVQDIQEPGRVPLQVGSFADQVRMLFADVGGVEIELPARTWEREPPDFSDF